MFFSLNFNYKYLRKADFTCNFVSFSKLYAPLLSSDAYKLYLYMCSEISIYDVVKSYKNKVSEICLVLGFNEKVFHEARENIEALGLLKTFTNKEDIIYFEIIEPLCFKSFSENMSLKNLLIDKVGKNYFHKIAGQLDQEELTKDFDNISSSLESFFSNKNVSLSKQFNFEKLYKNLSSITSINVTISKVAIETIDYYYKKNNLSFQEIERIVIDSIVKENNSFIVSNSLLESEFKKLCGHKDLDIFHKIVPLNRNKNIFIEKSSVSTLQRVFHDYKNLSPEQYLSSIYNTEISDEEKKIIDEIRNEFLFPDYVINIMIDFSLPITHSELNLKYLKKMGKTFKVNNVSSLEEIYEFLFKWKNRDFNEKRISKQSKSKLKRSDNDANDDLQNINDFENSENKDSDESLEEDLVSLDF